MKYLFAFLIIASTSNANAASAMSYQGIIKDQGMSAALLEIQGEQDVFTIGSMVSDIGVLESVSNSAASIRTNEGRLLHVDISGNVKEVTEDSVIATMEKISFDDLLTKQLDNNQTIHIDGSIAGENLKSFGLQNGDILVSSSKRSSARVLTVQRGADAQEIIVAAS